MSRNAVRIIPKRRPDVAGISVRMWPKYAYREIIEDGHPILIINARDIADILRKHGIGENEIKSWLLEIGD